MEKSEKKNHKKLSKFILASTLVGSAVGGLGYLIHEKIEEQNEAAQRSEDAENERRAMTHNDFSTYATNQTPDDDISDYLVNARLNKGSYLPTFSHYSDSTFENKKLIIQVLPSVSDESMTLLQDVVDYLNEVFTAGQMYTRIETKRVTTLSRKYDISFGFANLEYSISGQTTLYSPDMVSSIGEILMNKQVWTTTALTNRDYVFKSVVLHELSHCFNINHNNTDEVSVMYYTSQFTPKYWKMNPNDLRSFYYETQPDSYESNPERFRQIYNYIEAQAVEYAISMQNHTNAQYNYYMQPDTVAYLKFLANEDDEIYDYFTINLNDIFLGQYESSVHKKDGTVQEHTGRFYSFFDGDYTYFSNNQTDDQVFLLDDFKLGNFNKLTTMGFSQDRRFKLDIGISITDLRNMSGLCYNNAASRDSADVKQEISDYLSYIYPNQNIPYFKKEEQVAEEPILEKKFR